MKDIEKSLKEREVNLQRLKAEALDFKDFLVKGVQRYKYNYDYYSKMRIEEDLCKKAKQEYPHTKVLNDFAIELQDTYAKIEGGKKSLELFEKLLREQEIELNSLKLDVETPPESAKIRMAVDASVAHSEMENVSKNLESDEDTFEAQLAHIQEELKKVE